MEGPVILAQNPYMRNIALLFLSLVMAGYSSSQVSLLTEINPGTAYTNIRNLTAFQGKAFFFTANSSSAGTPWRLYKSDGTLVGTEIIFESDSIAPKSESRVVAVCNNKLFFITKTDHLWVTDGTTGGTHNLGQFLRNDTVQYLDDVSASGSNYVYLKLGNKGLGRVDAQTLLIDTFYNQFTNCEIVFARNGRAFTMFDPYNPVSTETGVYDLNQSKFLLTKSLDSFSVKQYPLSPPNVFLQFLNNDEFIALSQGSHSNPLLNVRLYKYNLTNDTKTLLAEEPENSGLVANNMVTAGGKVFFGFKRDKGQGQSRGLMYVTDGTIAGTDTLTLSGKYTYSLASQDRSFNNKSLFVISGIMAQSNRDELWITDGTQQGTLKLTQCADTIAGIGLNVSYASEGISYSDTLNGYLFFESNGSELWITDGTPAGTMRFCDKTQLTQFDNVLTVGHQLFMSARNTLCTGNEMWATDGNGLCTVDVSCPAGVSNYTAGNLKVYPNPAPHVLQVEIADAGHGLNFTWLSMEGTVMLQQTNLTNGRYNFSTESIPNGCYTLAISGTDVFYTQKVIVMHE
jgi:hypothetical protein